VTEDHSAVLALSDAPTVVRAARHFARILCQAWGYPQSVGDGVALVTSELVTSAITHTHARLGLRISDEGRRLRVAVEDSDERQPGPSGADEAALEGVGLAVVTNEATTWGVARTPHGRVLWAEFDVAS
jgi:anti-sigma regulatory factor (Ser/Thr protein kinase)